MSRFFANQPVVGRGRGTLWFVGRLPGDCAEGSTRAPISHIAGFRAGSSGTAGLATASGRYGQVGSRADSDRIANDIALTDIPVLAMVLDAAFVAKSDVRRWPAIGRFAWHFGCVFIEREKRGTTRVQAQAVEQHLRGPLGLAMFPEGTTGDGGPVLPFRCLRSAAFVHSLADGS